MNQVNAIFINGISSNLGKKIAAAVIPLGVEPSSLPAFITALNLHDTASLVKIPNVTPQVIGAGVVALKQAYNIAFRNVWIAAVCFTAVALLGLSSFPALT